MDDTTAMPASTRGRRWRSFLLVGTLVVGVMLGSAMTSVVWASHTFSDVPTNSPFHDDISWMAENGIANGYDDGTYRPTNAVSRQAFAAFLHRYNAETEMHTTVGPYNSKSFEPIVFCPIGKRPLSAGGSTTSQGVFITDVTLGPFSAKVRWESGSGGVVSGTVTAWAMCGPT